MDVMKKEEGSVWICIKIQVYCIYGVCGERFLFLQDEVCTYFTFSLLMLRGVLCFNSMVL